MAVVDPKYTKPVSTLIELQNEENLLTQVSGSNLLYSLCDRNDPSNNKGHYFMSFNLPFELSAFASTTSMARLYPELYQLNVDKIIICPIPANSYSEFLDGRSIVFTVPVTGGTAPTNFSAVTMYSSTYTSDKILKFESSPLLGDNIVYLFSDNINTPYTGKTLSEHGIIVDMSSDSTWNPTDNYLDRPAAVPYGAVRGATPNASATTVFNTDTRTHANYAVTVPSGFPESKPGYNYDVPCGFVVLDKGFLVITHPQIVNNFPWTSGFTSNGSAYVDDSTTTSKTDIYFTGDTILNSNVVPTSNLQFVDIDTTFKITAVCIALPREFYISNNITWNREKALEQIKEGNGVISFDPIYVTEIGLYNILGELIAVAKLSEPVEKNYTNVLNFNLTLEQ